MYEALPVLILYLLLASSITAHICRTLYTQYQSLNLKPPKDWSKTRIQVAVIALLALLCLGSTWYYMFAFFAYSYHDWACHQGVAGDNVDLDHIELWLGGTKLFEQAWNTVVESPQRFWWSEQIFFWTTGWSLFLGIMGRRYNIPHVWSYMLLGQIVAISFAQNLFNLAVILRRAASSTNPRVPSEWTPPTLLELAPLAVSLISSTAASLFANTPYFMPVLLIPHLLLFIPATITPHRLPKILAGQTHPSPASVTKFYVKVFRWLFVVSFILLAATSHSALKNVTPAPLTRAQESCAHYVPQATVRDPVKRVLGAVYEHPAVSSVGWDVILCAVTFFSWAVVNRFDPRRMVGGAESVRGEEIRKWE